MKLEERIAQIEKRNKSVELDKAWETSWTRRLTISVLTYGIVAIYLVLINAERPLVHALVPSVGFLLSTLVLKRTRDTWQQR